MAATLGDLGQIPQDNRLPPDNWPLTIAPWTLALEYFPCGQLPHNTNLTLTLNLTPTLSITLILILTLTLTGVQIVRGYCPEVIIWRTIVQGSVVRIPAAWGHVFARSF